jgi:hypothetical protein
MEVLLCACAEVEERARLAEEHTRFAARHRAGGSWARVRLQQLLNSNQVCCSVFVQR